MPAKRRKRRSSGTRAPRRNPTTTTSILGDALKSGWGDAKVQMGEVVKNTTSQLIAGLFQQTVQAGVGKLPGIAGLLAGVGSTGDSGGVEGWPDWAKKLLTSEYAVVPTVGQRDSGKSSLAVSMSEYRQKILKTPIFFVGYPKDLAPEHIQSVHPSRMAELFEIVPYGSTIIIDDASMYINSKRTMSGTGLAFEDLVNTAAHRGILLIMTVQDSSDLNKAGLRFDMLVLKRPEKMFLASERPRMQAIIQMALSEFDKIPQSDWVRSAFLWIDEQRHGMVTTTRPAWMDRAHAKYRRNAGTGEVPEGLDEVLPTNGRGRPLLPARAGPSSYGRTGKSSGRGRDVVDANFREVPGNDGRDPFSSDFGGSLV